MEPSEYFAPIYQIRQYPQGVRITAEKRFLLIKEYEDHFLPLEKKELGRQFQKTTAIRKFCDLKEISSQSFYRWYRPYRKQGIEGLLPKWGHRKGLSLYRETCMPIIKQVLEDIQPGSNYTDIFDMVRATCEEEAVRAPHYATFLRMLKREGLHHLVRKPKLDAAENTTKDVAEEDRAPEDANRDFALAKLRDPGWIKFTSKRAFNIAMYKYNLILPLINPNINHHEKRRMMEEILSRKHFVFPDAEIKLSSASLYRYVANYEKEGFNGLISKYHLREKRLSQEDISKTTLTIDLKQPLASLQELRNIIAQNSITPPMTKDVSLKLLDNHLRMMRPNVAKYRSRGLGNNLSDEDIEKLKLYRDGHHKRHSIKATAILLAKSNHTMLEIIMQTGASHQSVYRWLGRFEKEGIGFITGKRHKPPEKEKFFSDRKTRVVDILHSSPQLYGINRATWSYESIADAYNQTYEDHISSHMVGRVIHTTGYTWRHARTVLTSPDPQYKEKTAKVLDTLRNLKEDEVFFFIDEAGPYAVKHYAGKALTPRGTVRVVQQYQKIKGSVTFIGGLNAVTNQMTWVFVDAKSTSQVILLLEMLREQYASYAKLYLTWDAASWHSSVALREWVARETEICRKNNSGPLFELLPLPVNSQFLNVIEAVISGMKKAVIHNSDYATEEEMKAAISRHFEERNRYFTQNPKRAGNKIWDKEFFSIDQIQGGLFKKM